MATAERIPAQVFPPGEFIQEELEARGWIQSDLAEIMGRDAGLVSSLVTGKRSITPQTARDLGSAFGTGGDFWLKLEAAFQYSKVAGDDAVSRRAKLYAKAPIQHMIRRGWLKASSNVGQLEEQYKRFFCVSSVDEEPKLLHAARKSSGYGVVTNEQRAWLFRARHLAQLIDCSVPFSSGSVKQVLERLRPLLSSVEEIRSVPKILREAGIRFLVLENLPKIRIDGACFWLDKNSPVVVLGLRFDRVDWFWQTLLHELVHIKKRDGLKAPIIDSEMDQSRSDDARPEQEKRVDKAVASFLVPQDQLSDFIVRVKPFYSKTKIRGFAMRLGIHPGLVVGQLQYRDEISYAHDREMLEVVREIITRTALADGWGDVVQA